LVSVIGVASGVTYQLDQLPAVSCATTDSPGSGVSVTATLTLNRDATGQYTATCAGAVDNAGNQTPPKSMSYSVAPTADSLKSVTATYLAGSPASNAHGVLEDLTNKLDHGQICQYILKVNKEATGQDPAFTVAQAAELVYWARILDPTC
jgi:hypothetical protein